MHLSGSPLQVEQGESHSTQFPDGDAIVVFGQLVPQVLLKKNNSWDAHVKHLLRPVHV